MRLWQCGDPEDAWAGVILPWLRRHLPLALEAARPPIIACASRAQRLDLVSRMHDAGLAAAALRIHTPGTLRERLAARLGLSGEIAPREMLHFLLALAAEGHAAAASGDPDTRVAAEAVALDPAPFLQAYEEVRCAGARWEGLGPAELAPVFARFEELLSTGGWLAPHQADAALLAAAAKQPAIGPLLVAGFDGRHWPLWNLLQAAAQSSEEATVILPLPEPEAGGLHALWTGSWEERHGAAEPVPAASGAPREPVPPALAAARTLSEQARALALAAAEMLCAHPGGRIGILFAGPGALPRETARHLAQLGLDHDDAFGRPAPSVFERASWLAWLDFQGDPTAVALCELARRQPGLLPQGLDAADFEDLLRRAAEADLVDALPVLADMLGGEGAGRRKNLAAGVIRRIEVLPECASASDMLVRAIRLAEAADFGEAAGELARLKAAWDRLPAEPVSRRAFVRWVRETLRSARATRSPEGAQVYAAIRLLSYTAAENVAWDGLVLADLNEGMWPPPENPGLLPGEDPEFRPKARRAANRRAIAEGGQGEGHVAAMVRRPILGAMQRRSLALHAFRRMTERAARCAAVIRLIDENDTSRHLAPGPLFLELQQAAGGEPPDTGQLDAMADATARRLEAIAPREEAAPPDFRGMLAAYRARRAEGPFGEFEFHSGREPGDDPRPPLQLSCTQWERVIKHPASVWLETELGVSPRGWEELSWQGAIGRWVHQVLADAADARGLFKALPAPEALRAALESALVARRSQAEDRMRRNGVQPPAWWALLWAQAGAMARELAAQVAALTGWPFGIAEWPIGTPLGIPIEPAEPGNPEQTLHLRGRIDLLLVDRAPADTAPGTLPAGASVRVIDFKTRKGGAKLKRGKLGSGEGTQLGLYALLLRSLGAADVGLDLLGAGGELGDPQLALEDVLAELPVWREFARMEATGQFGMRAPVRAEYGAGGGYPLATLAIDPDLLEQKWEATHPDLG